MGAIGAHGHWDIRLLKQVIDFELYQHVIPQTRALHPVGGEGLLGAMSQHHQCLIGHRSVPVGQPSSPLPLVALAAELLTLLSSWDYCLSYHRMGDHLIASGTPIYRDP
jgi:hypothetical protein